MASPEVNSNWVFDFGLIEDIPVPGGDLPCLEPGFHWSDDAFSNSASVDFDGAFQNSDGGKEAGSRKRSGPWRWSATDSKAYREKMRRDKLNDRQILSLFILEIQEYLEFGCLFTSVHITLHDVDFVSFPRFQELSVLLDPERPAKLDKTAILGDATRMVIQLREEAQKLKESYENLQEKVNELKAEKNELRDEKQKLKAEKDKLEHQLKALSTQPGILHHPSAIPAPFAAPHQVFSSKLMTFVGYPGSSMWHFMSPAAVDTSEDHVLRPPVA